MPYRQKKTPNLGVPAKRGWCLKYVDDAGGATQRRASAQAAYNVEKGASRIRIANPPVGVWVVGFMSFTQGPFTKLGHVFFMKYLGNGKYDIRDSETRTGARAPYTNINQVISWFGAYAPRYVGWSTHCDGVQYAEYYTVPAKKTNTQIAREVIAGKWGNGPTRVARLTKAGYNYKTIQSIVNQLLS